ncbi:hypothetical protein MBRA_06308 [Methylobacterium brachiatum]|nr:hypothetical protein MBRA_06308 [Methylobacterium brachiatum]
MTLRDAYSRCAGPMGFWVTAIVAIVTRDLLFARSFSVGMCLLLFRI